MNSTTEAAFERLERRVQQLEDEREIARVIASYGYYADTGQDEAFVNVFTDDAAMEVSLGPDASDFGVGLAFWRGRAEIEQFVANPEVHHHPDFYRKSMHLNGLNLVVNVEADQARATCYDLILQYFPDGFRSRWAGAQEWLLRREPGGWRVTSRRRRELGDDLSEVLPTAATRT